MADGVHPAATLETHLELFRAGRRLRVPFLRQIEGPGAPNKIKLTNPEILIGRDEKAEITVLSAHVSRRHALIKCRSNEIAICDFESRNGIFLNGIKIHSAVLRDGDILQLGDVVFEFFED